MGFWTFAELAAGIIVSCLPVLPRLVQYIGPRISSAFSSEVKTRDVTPVQRKADKKFLGELSNWDEGRTAGSDKSSPQLPERGSIIDPSQASLARALDRLDRLDSFDRLDRFERRSRLDRHDPWTLPRLSEQPPGQILRTIHIETKTEPRGIGDCGFRLDIERQSLKSKALGSQ